jgi:hypothetical protein
LVKDATPERRVAAFEAWLDQHRFAVPMMLRLEQ